MLVNKIILICLGFIVLCKASAIYDLGGQWSASGGGDALVVIDNATVPGGIFSDLMNDGQIGDIFSGQGDADYSWVGQADWTYSRNFTVQEDLLSFEVVLLVFEGLDTFASISINGEEVGSSENMFVRYQFSVKKYLQVGQNEILVKFTSPVNKALELAEDPSNEYVIPPECPDPDYKGICHANRIRKMQASFSWDWGPAFASVGIWKNVYLQAFDNAIINDVLATATRDSENGNWTLWITTYISGGDDHPVSGSLDIKLNTENGVQTVRQEINKSLHRAGLTIIWSSWIEVSPSDVNTWWPNGYGTQSLYNLTVSFIGDTETSEKTVRVGFRTVELVQDALETGANFYFRINDQPIFAKGANEIPVNILPEKGQDYNTIKKLLEAVKDTNMNMLRVWGGGVYESDYFYDLADEYGILIWQDFMFACAMYPTDVDFLNNVKAEVQHQVNRLTSHPSVIIWSGNNENEGALRQNWYGTATNFNLFEKDYVTLYVDTIRAQVLENVPYGKVIYITSSPTNGIESEKEGYVANNPADSLYGDVHFYDYGSDSWSVSTYPIPRFASEYGFQSYPSYESWLTATDNLDDLNPIGKFMEYRQHHPGGNQQNLALISQQLQIPDATHVNYIKAVIYYSQIFQAQAIKTETEHYRSFKGRLDSTGHGNTMGALYWQLNDVWVAPTWSGIDFTGRWKMLQYFAKDFFSPLIVTGRLNAQDELEVYAVLDALEVPSIEIRALIRVYTWNNLNPLISVLFPVTLDPSKAVLVTTLGAESALNVAGCGSDLSVSRTRCFFDIHLVDQNNDDVAPVNYVFPEKLKNSQLSNALVRITTVNATNDAGTEFEITLSTNSVALFVWLDSHNIRGTFSENGFILRQFSKTVNFTSEEVTEVRDLVSQLTATHLRDAAYLT